MKIHVLEAGFRKRHPYKRLREALLRPIWFPVQNARWELRDLGVEVHFFTEQHPQLPDCDILILSSRTVDSIIAGDRSGYADRAEFCLRFQSCGCKIIWFDSRDSAGNCQFDVLPHVSTYLKRQVYRDRSVYLRPMYYGRMHSDYYHRIYGITDSDAQSAEGALTSERSPTPYVDTEVASSLVELGKVKSAWGCGAEFHWPLFHRLSFVRYFGAAAGRFVTPRMAPKPVAIDPSRTRDKTVAALFDDERYSLKCVGYQRALGLAACKTLDVGGKALGRRPRNKFYSTLARSQITVSTFGWGEVCYREYEATYCGSTVLMADMSAVETFPNFYVPDVYYIPYKWDFSDFDDKCKSLLNDHIRRRDIAQNAQDMLMSQWGPGGRQRFAERFLKLVS